MRLGVIHSVGPSWHSRAGGRIDRRITLDIGVTPREEGGPVLDPGGGLLGISTLGPRGRVLVIPASTVEAVLDPLLSKGRVERGWLGLALQPVLVPEALQAEAGQSQGLMVMSVSKDGPAARANLHAGDILVKIAGESVTSPSAVAQYLGPDSVGKQVELHLIRADKPFSIPVTVGIRPYQMSAPAAGVPDRLRVAVLASNAAAQDRLATLVAQCGHQLVEAAASPDAVLTDGGADAVLPASTVAVGAVGGEFAGWLPPDAGAAQVDAALRAVAAGLTVRATPPETRNFDRCRRSRRFC